MSDIIKMDYGLMEDMARTFERGASQLEETQKEVENLAATLEDGALLGMSGSAFSDALRDKMAPSIARLQDKFVELQADVLDAMRDMQGADRTSKSQF
jgi:WXG100 family type VII secretion target